jgi:hypothetical protein
MYNQATQVEALRDAILGSYYFKKKIIVGASPTVFLPKKVTWINWSEQLII